ncbi:MAG: pilus assembly protein [Homoserinimonas sp.]|nr:pilus assembly protein [Homoserinimonas sp.]
MVWGLLCGVALGVGLWSMASLVPALGRPRLVHRLAPYVADVSDNARTMLARRPSDPLPVFGALLGPATVYLREMLGRVLGGTATIEMRLRQAGSTMTASTFRSSQLVWTVGGISVGVVATVALTQMQTLPLAMHAVAVMLSGVAGLVLRDYLLQRAASARMARMASELPTILEFLTLSLSAGEGILDALRRVSRISRGQLAAEFGMVLAEVNTGVPLTDSLNRLAHGVRLPALSRSVEQITGALERGTPLAEVLRAQAQDARDDAKRELLEVAGKKEVAMLVPLIFLILPITVVFAIFPGIFVLQVGF